MRVLLVHPSALMYSEIFLRLEPLGLERVAAALVADGHEVRLIDLQVYRHGDLRSAGRRVRAAGGRVQPELPGQRARGGGPGQVGQDACCRAAWSSPAGTASRSWPGRSSSTRKARSTWCSRARARPVPRRCWRRPPDRALATVPGAVTLDGAGPPPVMAHSLDEHLPARHLGGRRRKYFIGVMDPAASIEFTRGCPWDCSFCSAWTFYGRSYRRLSPQAAAEDMARIAEPGVFIVDDVAFIKADEGEEIARQLERRRIRKQYYLETRCDVLIRNTEVFRRWRRLGLTYMFLGLEALDEEGLTAFRKRTTPAINNKALEIARSLGLSVAINIIADPDWDQAQVRLRPRLGDARPRDRQHHRADPLPRHRNLAHRIPPPDHLGLPALRRPARGTAHPAAAAPVLHRTGQDPGRPGPQAPRHRRARQNHRHRGPPAAARADQLRHDDLEIQQGLQRRPAIRRTPAPSPVPAAGSRGKAR